MTQIISKVIQVGRSTGDVDRSLFRNVQNGNDRKNESDGEKQPTEPKRWFLAYNQGKNMSKHGEANQIKPNKEKEGWGKSNQKQHQSDNCVNKANTNVNDYKWVFIHVYNEIMDVWEVANEWRREAKTGCKRQHKAQKRHFA